MCKYNPNHIHRDMSYAHSHSFKEKCSNNMKRRLLSGEVLHKWTPPNKALSYAEQYFYDILTSKCNGVVQWKNNYRVGKYWLDFANLQSHTYFEVDGEQHYTEDGLLHDAKRTEWLSQHGWHLIARVRWKCFYVMNHDEKDKYIVDLVDRFSSITNYDDNQSLEMLPALMLEQRIGKSRYKHTKAEWLNICKLKHEHTLATKIRDKTLKYKIAKEKGLIRSDGKINGRGVPNSLWETRKDLILNSYVDLHKFGWVSRVAKETGLSKRIIENTVTRFPQVFADKCFYRVGSKILSK